MRYLIKEGKCGPDPEGVARVGVLVAATLKAPHLHQNPVKGQPNGSGVRAISELGTELHGFKAGSDVIADTRV